MTYAFSTIFGMCKHVKIIEALVENYKYELSVPDIERMTDVFRTTIYRHMPKLVKEGIVIEIQGQRGKLYQLNINDPRIKMLIAIESFTISKNLESQLREMGETPLYEEIIEVNATPPPEELINKLLQGQPSTEAEFELVKTREEKTKPQKQRHLPPQVTWIGESQRSSAVQGDWGTPPHHG